MTAEEIKAVETLVNGFILSANAVETIETDPETAKSMGAMALFGEKYGKTVRLVRMGEVSAELCGGTHLKNTSEAGLFKVLSESSVAAGIRRIEGTTGLGVLGLLAEKDNILAECASIARANDIASLPAKVNALVNELRETKSEVESLHAKAAASAGASLEAEIVKTDKYSLLFGEIKDAKVDVLRGEGDRLRDKYSDIVGVLYSVNDGKIIFAAFCGKDALAKGAHAGNILKTISPIVGGGGGGRPDSASSGGKDTTKLPEAKSAFMEMMK